MTPETDPLAGATAWNEFCDGMKAAGHELLGDQYPDLPLDRAEGFKHLALLFEMAVRWYIEGNDPDFPRFVHLNDTFELADNRFAAIRDDAAYRITGNASSLFDINLSVHEGWAFLGQLGVWGDLGLGDLDVAPDGSFELVISRNRCDGNWLPMPDGATLVQLREYYEDWGTHTPGRFEIVRMGSEGEAPSRTTPDDLARRLRDAVTWAGGYTAAHMFMINQLRGGPPNTLQPSSRQRGGNANIAYAFGRFDLADDESLVLEFERPGARLWGVHWLTMPWYENPDLTNRPTSVNGHDAHVDDDGRVRVVLGAHDAGAPNWLDPGGFREGVIAARWVWGEGDGPPVTTTVVASERVADLLAPGTRLVDRTDRGRAQVRRRTHFAHRGR